MPRSITKSRRVMAILELSTPLSFETLMSKGWWNEGFPIHTKVRQVQVNVQQALTKKAPNKKKVRKRK